MAKTKKDETVLPETPHRCDGCNRLLFTGNVVIEKVEVAAQVISTVTVKCGRCGTMNKFKIHTTGKQNFQDKMYLNRAASRS